MFDEDTEMCQGMGADNCRELAVDASPASAAIAPAGDRKACVAALSLQMMLTAL